MLLKKKLPENLLTGNKNAAEKIMPYCVFTGNEKAAGEILPECFPLYSKGKTVSKTYFNLKRCKARYSRLRCSWILTYLQINLIRLCLMLHSKS